MKSTQDCKPGRKRIIVCCDGTWLNSDGPSQVPSNVTRIARALKSYGEDENGNCIPQVVFYQNGVGTGTHSISVKLIGGATGRGLAEHIREAYGFICLNYNPGDEIFLIGFSRGAFTARSISSLIRAVGLLTSAGLEYFEDIFEDWQFQSKPGWKPKRPNCPWPGHAPPVTTSEYQHKMLEWELTRPNIPIKAVAVWDTVGALGIPVLGILPQPPSHDFSFVNTKVEPNIEYAFQALALDEHRRSFSPTIWEKPDGQEFPRVLKQCWFPGVHADIGGSYPDTDLSNLTLCWMVNQLQHLLAFEYDYISRQVRKGIERQERVHPNEPPRPWGLGKIHNSFSPFYILGGSKTRTPKQYREAPKVVNPGYLWWILYRVYVRVGQLFYAPQLTPRLKNTNETVHSSVRIRMGKKGLGYNDKGLYESEALKGWTMYGVDTSPDTPIQQNLPGAPGKMRDVVWKKKVKRDRGITDGKDMDEEEELEMREDELGTFERQILKRWPEIEQSFDSLRPGEHKQNVQRASTYPTFVASIPNGTAEHDHDPMGGAVQLDRDPKRKPERMETI